ncbi:MAG: hypothetical protein LBD89_03650 [Tannerellaceae bacterium]|jgi:hypothetical protein|nr:hypothetical protein [Tannerellaceae bacterium]
MDIIRLEGEDKRLYSLVAHLIMRRDVLSYNLNYPYKTSPAHCWFIAADPDHTFGFVPVLRKAGKAQINNYYVEKDDKEIFAVLLEEIIKTLSPDFEIEAITQMRHIPNFEQNGFSIIFHWKRYVKMKLAKHEDEQHEDERL